jgi:hypothetical protein
VPSSQAFSGFEDRVEIMRDPGNGIQPRIEIPQLPWVHAMWQQAQNFVDAVAGLRPPMSNAADALADIQLARDYIRLHLNK